MNNKSSFKPLIMIIGVNFLWGIDFIAIEYMMHYMSPAVFTLCRLAIGAVLLLIACFLFRGGLHIQKQDMLSVFIAGATGMSLYFTIENLGTGLTSASFSALIMATVPIFGMIGDRLVYGNRITPLKVICILASIAGVLVTIATAIVCIIIGQFGYVYAIGHLSPTVVSAFENVLQVTTVVLSIFIFGKLLTGLQIIGAVLIMLSVTVIAIKSASD